MNYMSNNTNQAADREEILKKALILKEQKRGHLNFLSANLNITKKEARKIISDYINQPSPEAEIPVPETQEPSTEIIDHGNYTYNPATDTYLVTLKTLGKQVPIAGWKYKAILSAYSNHNGEPRNIDDLMVTYGFTRPVFEEFKRIMGFTHNSIPITDEEIALADTPEKEDTIVDNQVSFRKMRVFEKVKLKEWNNIQENSDKYELMKEGLIDPFAEIIKSYSFKGYTPVPAPVSIKERYDDISTKPHTFVIGLSDLHFGNKLEGEEAGNEVAKTKNNLRKYANSIKLDVQNRNYNISKAVILCLGDLIHTLSGFTKKGTKLDCSVLGEELYDETLKAIIDFVIEMLKVFPEIEVHCVKGNHVGIDEYILMSHVKTYFKDESRITFNLSRNRSNSLKVQNTAIIIDHGDSDYIAAKVPKSNVKKQTYIQSLFLQLDEELRSCKYKVFIQGDMHHSEMCEFNDFEFYLFGTMSKSDKYSQHLNLKSRPQQSSLIINEDGTKEYLKYYFD